MSEMVRDVLVALAAGSVPAVLGYLTSTKRSRSVAKGMASRTTREEFAVLYHEARQQLEDARRTINDLRNEIQALRLELDMTRKREDEMEVRLDECEDRLRETTRRKR